MNLVDFFMYVTGTRSGFSNTSNERAHCRPSITRMGSRYEEFEGSMVRDETLREFPSHIRCRRSRGKMLRHEPKTSINTTQADLMDIEDG